MEARAWRAALELIESARTLTPVKEYVFMPSLIERAHSPEVDCSQSAAKLLGEVCRWPFDQPFTVIRSPSPTLF
jgi:hypothetical protein